MTVECFIGPLSFDSSIAFQVCRVRQSTVSVVSVQPQVKSGTGPNNRVNEQSYLHLH